MATQIEPLAELGPTSLATKERLTFKIGDRLVWAFVAGLAFFGAVIGTEVGLKASSHATFLTVDELVKLATTFGSIIGPPLGFVISYYFKDSKTG